MNNNFRYCTAWQAFPGNVLWPLESPFRGQLFRKTGYDCQMCVMHGGMCGRYVDLGSVLKMESLFYLDHPFGEDNVLLVEGPSPPYCLVGTGVMGPQVKVLLAKSTLSQKLYRRFMVVTQVGDGVNADGYNVCDFVFLPVAYDLCWLPPAYFVEFSRGRGATAAQVEERYPSGRVADYNLNVRMIFDRVPRQGRFYNTAAERKGHIAIIGNAWGGFRPSRLD